MTNGSLMKVESIAECSLWKPILAFVLSGRLRQVLLYFILRESVRVPIKSIVQMLISELASPLGC